MKLRKILAVLLSTLTLASCTGTTDPDETDAMSGDETTNGGEVVENTQLLTHIFRGEKLSLPEEYDLKSSVTPMYDSETGNITCFCTCTVQDPNIEVTDRESASAAYITEKHIITLSPDGTVLEDLKLDVEGDEDAYIDQGTFSGDYFYYLSNIYNEASDSESFTVVKVNLTDGTATRSDELSTLFSAQEERRWFYINSMTVDSEGYVYLLSDNEILVMDSSFIKQFSVFASSWFDGLYLSADGTVYTYGRFDNVSGLCPIDKGTKALGSVIELSSNDSIFFGDGYDFYFTNEDGLYGFTLADSTEELVMSFQNSDLTENSINILHIIDSETFIASERDPDTYVYSLAIYKKAEDIDLSAVNIIEIASAGQLGYDVPALIVEYNKQNPQSRVIITDYSQYDDGMTKLTTDILNGIYKPDIVMGSSSSELIGQMVKNDLYTDLYTFIDKDDTVSRDDLFGAVKKMFDDDGKLYALTNGFTVHSLFGPKSVLGDRTSWTFAKMLDFAVNLPDGVELIGDLTQSAATGAIFGDLGYGAFIDEETNTAHFDSDEFIKFLEYIGTLPATIDYSALPEDYRENEYLRRFNGEIALETARISEAFDWLRLQVFFNTEDYTLIGYPTSDGSSGSYAAASYTYMITSFCDTPDEAWKLVKNFCVPDDADNVSLGMGMMDGFPILKSTFDVLGEDNYRYQFRFYLDGSGGGAGTYNPENPKTQDDYSEPVIFDFYTEEDHAAIKEFLDTKVGARDTASISDEITAIVNEEITAYTSGTRDAKATADIIQSRVGIWLAEHD